MGRGVGKVVLAALLAAAALPAQAAAGAGDTSGARWEREPMVAIPGYCPAEVVWTSAGTVLVQPRSPSDHRCSSSSTGQVLDVARGSWRAAAPLPAGTVVEDNLPQRLGPLAAPVGGDGFAYLVGRRADSQQGMDFLLRYSDAGDRWDVFAMPGWLKLGIGDYRMIVAGRHLVLLDVGGYTLNDSYRPGRAPAGAVLGPDGGWYPLPPDPFGAPAPAAHRRGARTEPYRDGVWTGDRLILSARAPDRPTSIRVAALGLTDLERPGARWAMLPDAVDVDPRANPTAPVAVGGRVVWTSVVYDPATGTSRRTPIAVRDRARSAYVAPGSSPVPNATVFGDRVVLQGEVYDPVTGQISDFPEQPDKVAGQAPRGSVWAGSAYGILRLFGGICEGVAVPVELVGGVGDCVPVDPYLLQPGR